MNFQPPVEAPANADYKPEALASYRDQLIGQGVESNLAAEAAYILTYVDPKRSRTEMEQQTIKLAFQDIHWGGQLDG